MPVLLRVATKRQRCGGLQHPSGGGGLTGPLDVVHTLLNEERDGPVGRHQVLQGDAKVAALPGSPGGGVQRLEGLGWFLEREEVEGGDETEERRQNGRQEKVRVKEEEEEEKGWRTPDQKVGGVQTRLWELKTKAGMSYDVSARLHFPQSFALLCFFIPPL